MHPIPLLDTEESARLTPEGRLARSQFLLATKYRCHHLLGPFWEDPSGRTVRLTADDTLVPGTDAEREMLTVTLAHRGYPPHCPGCARCDF